MVVKGIGTHSLGREGRPQAAAVLLHVGIEEMELAEALRKLPRDSVPCDFERVCLCEGCNMFRT
jgi:hypothetical protein